MTESAPTPSEPPARRSLSRGDFQEYSPLIRREAMLLSRRAPTSVTVADLCVRGFSGLAEALGCARATAPASEVQRLVMSRVRVAMAERVRSAYEGYAELRAASRDVARALCVLDPTRAASADVAKSLGMSLSRYESMLLAIHGAGMARLDVMSLDRDEGPAVAVSPVELARAVAALPSDAQTVLMLVHEADCCLAEAALVLESREDRATVLYTEAIHRIRALIGKE
jgi:RNA polymerase sigma factor for flagellar operon FliA